MKLQLKNLWLWGTPLLVIGAIAGGVAWSNRCADNCYVALGNFSSDAAGTQAALKQLAQQIKRCPKASLYTAHYDVLVKSAHLDSVSIKYEPSTSILVYEPGYSAEIQLWRNVKVQAVRAVAQTGNLANLKRHGCYRTR